MVKIKEIKTVKTPKSAKKLKETPFKTKSVDKQKTPKLKRAVELTGLESVKKSAKKLKKAPQKEKVDYSALEVKYSVAVKDVEKAVQGVIKFGTENPKLQNQLFGERFPLFLQVGCVKVPKGHSKILRLPLAHSMLSPDDDICMIVRDVKGVKNKEHDKHLEHYEELFAKKGVKNIKKIMTFHEFRTEYETFELRSRLVDLYDYFLVDAKVSGKVVRKCGKIFYKKRKVPNPIKLQATNLKEHIEKSLLKTQFQVSGQGDNFTVQFGHSKMELEELVGNVYSLIEGLDKFFPGGFANIKSIHVYSHRASSIPVYVNLKNPNEVEVPKIESSIKLKGPKVFSGELSTVTNANVVVKKDGSVKVIKTGEKNDPDEITIEDIVKDNKLEQEKKKNNKRKKGKKEDEQILVQEEGEEKKEPPTKKSKKDGKPKKEQAKKSEEEPKKQQENGVKSKKNKKNKAQKKAPEKQTKVEPKQSQNVKVEPKKTENVNVEPKKTENTNVEPKKTNVAPKKQKQLQNTDAKVEPKLKQKNEKSAKKLEKTLKVKSDKVNAGKLMKKSGVKVVPKKKKAQ